jgi:hypothetical protein
MEKVHHLQIAGHDAFFVVKDFNCGIKIRPGRRAYEMILLSRHQIPLPSFPLLPS